MTSVCCQSQYQWNCTSVALFVSTATATAITTTNNNNNHDIVYGAIIMTKVIARVHPVHLMNVDWAQGGHQPSDQATWLGLWVCQKLAAAVPIHHRHCYYYSTYKVLILILPSHGGWKTGRLSWPSTAVNVRNPCPRLYIAAAVAINTTVHHHVIRTLVLAHRSWTR